MNQKHALKKLQQKALRKEVQEIMKPVPELCVGPAMSGKTHILSNREFINAARMRAAQAIRIGTPAPRLPRGKDCNSVNVAAKVRKALRAGKECQAFAVRIRKVRSKHGELQVWFYGPNANRWVGFPGLTWISIGSKPVASIK